MLLAYILLFFLLSCPTCDATSRSHRLFFLVHAGDANVHAPSPAIHDDHRRIAKDLFYEARYPYRVMGAPPPRLPVADDLQPPDNGIVMAPSPSPSPSSSPPHVDNNNGGDYGEPGGGDVVNGGGEGGPPSEAAATEHEESSLGDNISFDYAEPETHPPSHN